MTEAQQKPGADSSGLREAEEAVEIIVRLTMSGKVMGLLTAVALCLFFFRRIRSEYVATPHAAGYVLWLVPLACVLEM